MQQETPERCDDISGTSLDGEGDWQLLIPFTFCLVPAHSLVQDSKPRVNLSLRIRRAGKEITLLLLKMISQNRQNAS